MYEYNGQQYTLDQVQEAANKRNMSLDDYVSEFGVIISELCNFTCKFN